MKSRSLLPLAATLSLAAFLATFALPLLLTSLALWMALLAHHSYAPSRAQALPPAHKSALPLAA